MVYFLKLVMLTHILSECGRSFMDATFTFKIVVLLVLKAGHQLQLEAEETRRTSFCATKNATIQNGSQI